MTTTVSTPSVIDTRTDDFRAVLSNFKLFKNEEGSHWTFAGDTSLTNLDTSMQVTLQHFVCLHIAGKCWLQFGSFQRGCISTDYYSYVILFELRMACSVKKKGQAVSLCWFIHTALLSIPFLIVAAKACSRAQLQFWSFGNESRKKPFLMILQVISRGFGLAEFIQGTHQVLYCEIYLFDWFPKIESPQDEHREFSWNPLKCFVEHLFPLSLRSTFYNDVRTSGCGKDTLHIVQDIPRLRVAFWNLFKARKGIYHHDRDFSSNNVASLLAFGCLVP